MIKKARVFLDQYWESLDKKSACDKAGLSARDVRKLTEPRFVQYDAKFAEEYLCIQEEIREYMMSLATGIARGQSRQAFPAMKFVHGEATSESNRVEEAHIRWLEEQAKDGMLEDGSRKKLVGVVSLAEVKKGDGSFKQFQKAQ